jgi:hypothetical protein
MRSMDPYTDLWPAKILWSLQDLVAISLPLSTGTKRRYIVVVRLPLNDHILHP